MQLFLSLPVHVVVTGSGSEGLSFSVLLVLLMLGSAGQTTSSMTVPLN